MPLTAQEARRLAIIKIGGSVLTDLEAYRRCSAFLGDRVSQAPGERLIVIVSAEFGTTDGLAALAREVTPDPNPATLDLLWVTGELRSVAVLTLCLHDLGVDAVGLNVHQCGLHAAEPRPDKTDSALNPLRLRRYLARHRVVVVPGFLAKGADDAFVTLGRGGSDLTAVLLASELHADRCELIKDVPGYFSSDPRTHPEATPIAALTYDRALEMAAQGCDLVQVQAIVAARRTRTPLVIRGLDEKAPRTVVAADVVDHLLNPYKPTALVVG